MHVKIVFPADIKVLNKEDRTKRSSKKYKHTTKKQEWVVFLKIAMTEITPPGKVKTITKQ